MPQVPAVAVHILAVIGRLGVADQIWLPQANCSKIKLELASLKEEQKLASEAINTDRWHAFRALCLSSTCGVLYAAVCASLR